MALFPLFVFLLSSMHPGKRLLLCKSRASFVQFLEVIFPQKSIKEEKKQFKLERGCQSREKKVMAGSGLFTFKFHQSGDRITVLLKKKMQLDSNWLLLSNGTFVFNYSPTTSALYPEDPLGLSNRLSD